MTEKEITGCRPEIISASRRTDIPAYYLDWLYHVLKRGWVNVRNPFNANQSRHVDLRPEAVHTLVLWSKDFSRLLHNPRPLKPYRLFFQFTLNGPNPLLEPGVPPLDQRLEQMGHLARRFGPERINWRFDPIVFWKSDSSAPIDHPRQSPFAPAEAEPVNHNAAAFQTLAPLIRQTGIRRCSVALLDIYKKTRTRTRAHGIHVAHPQDETIRALCAFLTAVAAEHDLQLSACCSPELLLHPSIKRARCIDGKLLNYLANTPKGSVQAASQRAAPTRQGCGCTKSRDIGDYRQQPCHHGCLYCYANPSRGRDPGAGVP